MMTPEDIQLLTQTGPGTPCGELMRRYWLPAALSEELPASAAPLPVRLLGEDLVLFRDEKGRPGLMGIHCSHRGADLSYGRLEDGGLRCIYHGWLYDLRGNCLDMPGEPGGGKPEQRASIHHPAYPCQERGGVIFAFLGKGEPPLLPNYEALGAPETHRFVKKFYQECNYLQSIEGNIDPAHQSFLHKRLQQGADEDTLGTAGAKVSNFTLYREDVSPVIEVEETDYGLRVLGLRVSAASAGKGMNWLKVLNYVFPCLAFVPGGTGADGHTVHWNVPIDDTHHWKYMLTFRRRAALGTEKMQKEFEAEAGLDYKLLRNRSNRYMQDRESMKNEWFSGMGAVFPAHDVWATDGQGPIQDRTREVLGYTDKAVVAARLLLLRTIRNLQKGKEPPHLVRDQEANGFPHLVVLSEVVPDKQDWRNYWRKDSNSNAKVDREAV